MTLLQLKVALIGLDLETRTGMKMTSKVNTYRIVADYFGFPKSARPRKEALVEMLRFEVAERDRLRKLQGA